MRCALLTAILLSSSLVRAATQTGQCYDSGFSQFDWPILVSQEPQLERTLADLGRASGQGDNKIIDLSHCVAEWPVDDRGEKITGMRTVVMDKSWKDSNGALHQGGIKLLFWKTITKEGNTTRIVRKLKGTAYCYSPRACDQLEIPFPKNSITYEPHRKVQISIANILPKE